MREGSLTGISDFNQTTSAPITRATRPELGGFEEFGRQLQFLIGTSMSMLLGVIPGTEDPEVARRYLEVFVLPALVADPPPPRDVFSDGR
ncbi:MULTISPECIES: hypothetical protein [unclassified Mycobacterium]|uniref:hypothetical protein n=1 Tax=unclassified Mycobacterium TaxID=2642494 RepID=UPI0029C6C7F2|nr:MULTISPECIES: hypothetical protein [unclassified Mycobacterium]